MKQFDDEVELVKKLYNDCWEDNWGFIPMTDAEIDVLATAFKPVVIPELVPVRREGRQADRVRAGAARPQRGCSAPIATARMFPASLTMLYKLKMKKLTRSRILLLGVLPEWRGKGIDSALYHWIWTKAASAASAGARRAGCSRTIIGIIQGLSKAGFTPYQTFRILDRPT